LDSGRDRRRGLSAGQGRALAAAAAATLLAAAALATSIIVFVRMAPSVRQAPQFTLRPFGTVADLPGWAKDDQSMALAAFRGSCAVFERMPPTRPLGRDGLEGMAGDWQAACAEAARVPVSPGPARAFFERTFAPALVLDGRDDHGLFTGYYEPELHGSRVRTARYQVPLLAPPTDLVSVDLGDFLPEMRGRRIAGRVFGGKLVPYPERAAIEAGALGGRSRPILWVDDPVEAFFLHIQGSGRIVLRDGTTVRVGYAAKNGQPYTAIGRVLVKSGALAKDDVSLQSIAQWLRAHPDEAAAIMDENRSYVFFRVLDTGDAELGPPGSQGVPLTPGRSLAVDPAFHALGVPVWLDTVLPDPKPGGDDRRLRRLVIAQDTGGAITGAVRGDMFWGFGPDAEAIAGRMKSRGRMIVLLPRPVLARLTLGHR
jgi:membrane-bound lytic murein transglycosylase A